jgi:hypothetical protein
MTIPHIYITEAGCLWTAVHERAQFLPWQNFWTCAKMEKMHQCAHGLCLKIMVLEKEWATIKVVMASLVKFYYVGNLLSFTPLIPLLLLFLAVAFISYM